MTGKLGVYCVSERPMLAARMLNSLVNNSVQPNIVVFVTTRSQQEAGMWECGLMQAAKQTAAENGIQLSISYVEDKTGLVWRKNKALTLLYSRLGVDRANYGFNIDDDFVVEPLALEELANALDENPQVFAVGPLVRQKGNLGLGWSPERYSPTMAYVDEAGIWRWGGFRQGIKYDREFSEHYQWLSAQHLAGVFLHRLDGSLFDEKYDRGNFFLHESDFVFGKENLVAVNAITHHWPPTTGNLSEQRETQRAALTENMKYFAEKHQLGRMETVDWNGFEIATPGSTSL